MKLRNKKTGSSFAMGLIIGELYYTPEKEYHFTVVTDDPSDIQIHKNVSQLCEEWEDYEELKKYWYITGQGNLHYIQNVSDECEYVKNHKKFGNHFATREEAEKVAEKMKAWKRLKDAGFKFDGIKEDWSGITTVQTPFRNGRRYIQFNKSEDELWLKENWEDLDLLFGGER